MAYIYDLSDTWNAGATVFTGIKLNVTDTTSAAGSLLMDLQVGGVSRFSVEKTGVARAEGLFRVGGNNGLQYQTGGTYGGSLGIIASGALRAILGGSIIFGSGQGIQWDSSGSPGTLVDLILARDAANTLAQRNGVNAQTKRLYGTFTDASNYRRLTKTMSTAGVAEIKPEGAGTGVSGNVLHISGLPTSNPGPGILWNNAGTPAIGT